MAFTPDDIREILELLDEANLIDESTATTLMSRVPPSVREGRRPKPSARSQIRADLKLIAAHPDEEEQHTAAVQWLSVALDLTEAGTGPQNHLQRLLDAQTGDAIAAPSFDLEDGASEVVQEIILKDDMVAVAFLEAGRRAAEAVCRVTIRKFIDGQAVSDQAHGTGWLVTPDHILTCMHVLHARSRNRQAKPEDLRLQAINARAEFAYFGEHDAGDAILVAEQVFGDEELDVALLRLKQAVPGVSPLVLSRADPEVPEEGHAVVNIIQHPRGGPKMIALRNNAVSGFDPLQLRYFTDTRTGSSGAPVMDDRFRVLAVHRAVTYKSGLKYLGRHVGYVNAGTRIGAVLEKLDTAGIALPWDVVD